MVVAAFFVKPSVARLMLSWAESHVTPKILWDPSPLVFFSFRPNGSLGQTLRRILFPRGHNAPESSIARIPSLEKSFPLL